MMRIQFVGYLKSGSKNARILVRSESGRFYVWKGSRVKIEQMRREGFLIVATGELELASEKQVASGRATGGRTSVPDVPVEFWGVVHPGKVYTLVLVRQEGYKVGKVRTEGFDVELPRGTVISIDHRTLSPAREDHIEAGLGQGKLRRHREKAI
jgi:hypothetical protein